MGGRRADGAARIAELRQEERLIRAWIRDVTAAKRGRLRQIRRELAGVQGLMAPGVSDAGNGRNGRSGNGLRVKRGQ